VLGVVVPLAVVVRVGLADPLAGLTIAATLPLIPVFGALVGRAAGEHARQRWRSLAVLSHHFLDIVTGLPTLKVFGRGRSQREAIGRATDDYRRTTMQTLRVAFLSSLVLELVATLSVAMVAVGVGLSLVYGHLDLRTGLLALIPRAGSVPPVAPGRRPVPRDRRWSRRRRPGHRRHRNARLKIV
jgi:ABC-type transport system involved in cytochrome bd biosynthesis fused ATPase/permease subunit